MQIPIQPKFPEEEFPDYQKHLDDMAAPASSVSGQKRSRVNPTEGEGKIEDT